MRTSFVVSILALAVAGRPDFADAASARSKAQATTEEKLDAGDPRRQDNDPGDEPSAEPTSTAYTVEAGVWIKDLGRLHELGLKQRARMNELSLWQAYWAPGTAGDKAFDSVAELARLLTVAGNGAAPTQLIAVALSGEGGFHWQAALQVAPGLEQRLAAVNTADASWKVEPSGDGFTFVLGDTRVDGRVVDGWLRIGDGSATLGFVAQPPTFRSQLGAFVEGEDAVLFVRPGGHLGEVLHDTFDDAQLSAIFATAKDIVVSIKSDGDKTSRLRLLVDADALAQLGPAIRSPKLRDAITPLWGAEVTSFVSLALPAPLLQGVLSAAQQALVEAAVPPMPEALQAALTHLDGRLGLGVFGAAQDLALGLELDDARHATTLVPALAQWLQAVTASTPSLSKVVLMAPLAEGMTSALLATPDPALDGVRVLAVQDAVLVAAQRQRAEQLAAAPGQGAAPLGGPLTQMVRATVEKPALLSGYSLLTSDGAFTYLLGWVGKAAEVALDKGGEALALPPVVKRALYRLPLALAGAGAEGMLLYDGAVSLDVSGSVLVLELCVSEI